MPITEHTWMSPACGLFDPAAFGTPVDELFATGNTVTQDWLPNPIQRQADGDYTYVTLPSPTAPEDPEELFDTLLAAASNRALRAALRNDD